MTKRYLTKLAFLSRQVLGDEFYQDAKKIKQIGSYITNDPGNAGFFNAMVWQAGGHPYSTSKDGTKVTVKLTTDKGVQKFCDFWQKND